MAKRGAKPRPEFVRYYEAGGEPAIYLVEVGELVKVGRSSCPVQRLKGLHGEHKMSLGRFIAFPQANARNLYWLECRAISALRAVASNVEGRREYFTGVTFDAAVAIVTETLAS
jgi:hypothetical protein